MGFALFTWVLAGWCGTVPRRWPFPNPDPDPWWRVAVGVAAGVAGGFIAYRFGVPTPQPAFSLATVLGTALVGFGASVAASDLAGRLAGERAPARVGQVANARI